MQANRHFDGPIYLCLLHHNVRKQINDYFTPSERIGWVPEAGEVPQSLVQDYRWIFGLSVTEMEIVHGAYRKDNPNCKFLYSIQI